MAISKLTMTTDKTKQDPILPAVVAPNLPSVPSTADVIKAMTDKINELVDAVNTDQSNIASLQLRLPKL